MVNFIRCTNGIKHPQGSHLVEFGKSNMASSFAIVKLKNDPLIVDQ